MKTLSFALSFSLAAFAFACSAEPTTVDPAKGTPDESGEQPAAETPAPEKPKDAPKVDDTTPKAEETPAVPAGITTAKIREGVRSFAASNDALWIATDTTVEKTAADGTAPVALTAFGKTINVALDDARVYGLVDKGNFYEVLSTKADGTEPAHHLNWLKSNGEPNSLALSGGRIFFSTTTATAMNNRIMSASATPPLAGNAPYRTEEQVDAKAVVPVFTADRLFAVDHVRQSAVRVTPGNQAASVDFIQDKVPLTAGGIATDGTDVYTRTTKGIVRAPVNAGSNATPTVVIPGASCAIFDEGTGAESVLEDALVIDGKTIYAACRAGTNVEIRAFDVEGKLTKTVATVPYGTGMSHLRITTTAAYWLSKPTTTTTELWRAAK